MFPFIKWEGWKMLLSLWQSFSHWNELEGNSAHSWGGTSSWWCGHMTQRFSITVYHMPLLPGLIAPTGTLQKSVGRICCICALRVLSPCERNTQKFLVPGTFPYCVIVERRLLGWPPSFWTLCQPLTVHPCWFQRCSPFNPHVLPNLRPLNPDYQGHARTLRNKITALLRSWATFFQINPSKLIWCNDVPMISHAAHQCTCARPHCHLGWRTVSVRPVIPLPPPHYFNLSCNPLLEKKQGM